MSNKKASDFKSAFDQLEVLFDEYLGKKAPIIPENIKETFVSFAPYYAMVIIILSLPSILSIFNIGTMIGPFSSLVGTSYTMSYSIGYYMGVVGFIISGVLDGLAINGLFKRSIQAWRLIYYSSLITCVSLLLQGNLGSAFVGGLLLFYILFQLKEKYQ